MLLQWMSGGFNSPGNRCSYLYWSPAESDERMLHLAISCSLQVLKSSSQIWIMKLLSQNYYYYSTFIMFTNHQINHIKNPRNKQFHNFIKFMKLIISCRENTGKSRSTIVICNYDVIVSVIVYSLYKDGQRVCISATSVLLFGHRQQNLKWK